MQRGIGIVIAAGALALAGCASTGGDPANGSNVAPDKVVYHINDSKLQARNGLRNINNHLEVNPQAQIRVVTHAQGVDFLMDNARDANGNPFNIDVEDLKSRGVRFEICEITLRNRQLDKRQFIPEATYVPSGVAEIAKLQARFGYAYVRP